MGVVFFNKNNHFKLAQFLHREEAKENMGTCFFMFVFDYLEREKSKVS